MTALITDLLKQAVDSDTFLSAIDKNWVIEQYRNERTPEHKPSNRMSFANAILPIAEALYNLLDSGLHTNAIDTTSDVVREAYSITVQFEQIRCYGKGAAAEMFAPDSPHFRLRALTLRFAPNESVLAPAQVELVLPFWQTCVSSIQTPRQTHATVTFTTTGEVHCPLGFPGAPDVLAVHVGLLGPYIQGIVPSHQ